MSDRTSYKQFAIAFLWSVALLFGICPSAIAQSLNDRWVQFPDWQSKPSVQVAKGDLVYPEWMAGTFHLKIPNILQHAIDRSPCIAIS